MLILAIGIVLDVLGGLMALGSVASQSNDVSSSADLLATIFLMGWVALIAGVLLIVTNVSRRTGAILAIIGSVPFLPLGMVSIFGARRAMYPAVTRQLAEKQAVTASGESTNRSIEANDETSTEQWVFGDRLANTLIVFGIGLVIATGLGSIYAGVLNDMLRTRSFWTTALAGVLLIVFGIRQKKHPVVVFKADYFKSKVGLGVGWHAVPYAAVRDIDFEKQKIVVRYDDRSRRSRQLNIRLNQFNSSQKQKLRSLFQTRWNL